MKINRSPIEEINLVEVNEFELQILEQQLEGMQHPQHSISLMLFSVSMFAAAIATGKVTIIFSFIFWWYWRICGCLGLFFLFEMEGEEGEFGERCKKYKRTIRG